MLISNLNEHVQKAINEVNMKYSSRMKFSIYDLVTVDICKNAGNFSSFKSKLESRLILEKIASPSAFVKGVRYSIKNRKLLFCNRNIHIEQIIT